MSKLSFLNFAQNLDLDWNSTPPPPPPHPGGWRIEVGSQVLLLRVTHHTFGVITLGGMDGDVKSVLDYRWHIEF